MLKEKILLIDDNDSILKAYKSILKNEGYEVDTAESGESGIEIMKEQGHQIVITDIKFSPYQMDGFKVIEEVKRLNSNCEVIVITGYSDLDLAIKAMHFDASDFIPKPCRKQDLLLAIKRASEKLQMRLIVKEYTENLQKIIDKKEQEMARIEEKLIHTAKLSAMGEMAASICHELCQPLSGIMGFTYMAAEDLPENTKAKWYIKKIEEQIIRMEQILKNLRVFSRKSDGDFLPLNINEVVESSVCLFMHQFKNQGIQLIEELGKDIPPIIGNKTKLQQVIVNLLSNARDALNDVNDRRLKKVTIKTDFNKVDQKVEISVADNGIGIEEKIRQKIFQSFFTTKSDELGTGLGLSVSKSIVSDLQGEIEFKSKKDCGSKFIISLPMADQSKIKTEKKDRDKWYIGGDTGQMDICLSE